MEACVHDYTKYVNFSRTNMFYKHVRHSRLFGTQICIQQNLYLRNKYENILRLVLEFNYPFFLVQRVNNCSVYKCTFNLYIMSENFMQRILMILR